MWVILKVMLFYFPLKGLQSSFYWSQGSFSAWGTFLTYVFCRCPARIFSRGRGESLPVTYQNYWCMLIMIFSVRQMQKLIVGNCELEYFNLLWINLICRISAGFSAILLTSMSSLLHCWVCWRQQLKLQMKANSQQSGNASKKWQRYEVLMTEK